MTFPGVWRTNVFVCLSNLSPVNVTVSANGLVRINGTFSCILHNCRHRVPLFSEHRLLAFCSSQHKCSTRARALKMSSRSWKATRNSALADHETDREETILRSQVYLMEEQILQLEELNERVSTIQDVVAQLDGKS